MVSALGQCNQLGAYGKTGHCSRGSIQAFSRRRWFTTGFGRFSTTIIVYVVE